MKRILFLNVLLLSLNSLSQANWKDTSEFSLPELKKNLNQSGTHYLKGTFLAQTWARYSELNPGSAIDGFDAGSSRGDIGIRRLRLQFFGQLTDRIFFYTQFGQNNLSILQPRHTGSFFHDAVTEYKVLPNLQIGGGLTAWSGMSRFSAPSVANILGVDAPLYQQVTNGINDQFARKLSLYAKGEIARLQYRIALSNPFTVKNSTVAVSGISSVSNFSLEPPKMQTSGYLVWQFKEKESYVVPYMNGTYYGKKKVLNIGAGWIQQNNAMWRTNEQNDTVRENMLLLGLDAFTELPLGTKGAAVTGYLAYNNFHYGKNYLRMNGAMNPVNGVLAGQGTVNGGGVSYPMIGTGDVIFGQLAYKFKDDLLPDEGTLQIYAGTQYSQFEALKDPSVVIEGGVNWLIHGNGFGKLTFGVQNRPIFITNSVGENVESSRKNMYVLQYQISL